MAYSSQNTAAIRDLLTAAFSDEELTTLCFDGFRQVYDDFASGMSKGQKIQRLLDYCLRRDEMDRLLHIVEQRNPAQYRRFESRLTSDRPVPASAGEDTASLRRQLAEAETNLRLIHERKAQFVLETDVPLQLVKEERALQQRIAELKRQLGE